MSKLFFLVGFAILALASSARVVRDAPATPEFNAESVFSAIQDGLKNLGNAFLQAAGATDSKDLEAKATAKLAAAEERIKVWVEGARKDTEHLKDTPMVQDLRAALDKLSSDFKAAHPGLTAEVSEQVNKVNENVEEVVKKIKALEDSEQSKQFKETANKLVDSAKEQLHNLAKEFEAKPQA
ncbi:uncharacterized protein LOC106088445 [Stomoxys calcitrans]|uniref:Apolipophorin-III n=1 Tax=Stomoxys calcitrans TaxID=35570 RepID=A0A1I8NVN1_STOCA|nr:uncharacterized protein LOC106088445 [Stomoxys calcitrans]